ncbi:MAG TPA: ASCH domain-containing protein [Bryobacteraceae bacterium]|nr:ASCH domain-containing protein [Bryobacteraceae bacterium]
MEMKVIVVRQPWSWLIVTGHKDIENRTWRTHYRGALLIQASANLPPKRELEEHRAFAKKRGVTLPDEFETGGVIGLVTLKDCVSKSASKWFEGPIGWELEEARQLKFIRLKGRLGIFDPPLSVQRRVMEQLGLR